MNRGHRRIDTVVHFFLPRLSLARSKKAPISGYSEVHRELLFFFFLSRLLSHGRRSFLVAVWGPNTRSHHISGQCVWGCVPVVFALLQSERSPLFLLVCLLFDSFVSQAQSFSVEYAFFPTPTRSLVLGPWIMISMIVLDPSAPKSQSSLAVFLFLFSFFF